ncbi:hypothetical protein [Aquibaculum sediminis]|uniref:hypothetical protein n=1 Tax=Aquibaculum sediminis TaxID=3231907 RepID=UPI00345666EA
MTLQARFIYGAIAGIVALVGLMVAAGASSEAYHTGGLILAGLGLLVCALLIKSHYDSYERDPNRRRRPRPLPAAAPAPTAPPSSPQPVGQGFAAVQPQQESRFDAQTMTWVRGGVIGVVGLLGLVVAAGGSGFAYWGGLVVFALAVVSLFRMIGRAFDGQGDGSAARLVPEAGVLRWIVGGLSGAIALLALFLASGGGDGYYIGVMLALAALGYVFYLIKASFDEYENH